MTMYIFLVLCTVVAQTKQASGIVTSFEDGEPIIGASIIIKGTNQGTVTDFDGKFVLNNIPESAKTIVVTYVGMQQEEATISPQMKIRLKSDSELLDEVIVVAYGTAKKSSFTGSASVVNSKSLQKRALTNVMSALEGNAPGVQVTSASGQPGSSPSVRIRGFGTINGSSAPLYVVDGSVYTGAIGNLNPNDIESMTVLKDAASTALYGSSAGNGVVLITTKSASGSNRSSVTFDAKVGFSGRGIKEYDKVNEKDTYLVGWEMLKNNYMNGSGKDLATASQMATDNLISTFGGYNAFLGIDNNDLVRADGSWNPLATTLKWGDDNDWEDAVYRTGVRQDYNVSYSTKTDKSDGYASFGYVSELGSQVNTDYQRFSGRVNLNVYPVSWFKGGVSLNGTKVNSTTNSSNSDSSSSYVNLSRWVRYVPTIYPVHKHDLTTGDYILDASGSKQYDYDGSRIFSSGRDALAEAYWNKPEFNRNALLGNVYADFYLFKGFTASINANISWNDYRASSYNNTKVGDGAPSGRLSKTSTRATNVTFNQLLKYNRQFGKHQVDLLAGHESYSYEYNYLYAMKNTEIMSDVYEFANMVNISSLSSYTDKYTKEGWLFRGNYSYDDKYYISGSYRRDGSSKFSKDTRWGNFWSVGASWRIDQEKFMESTKDWLTSLRIRASHGETGNDNLGSYYLYQTLYNSGINNGNEAGVYFSSYGNPNLKWETQVSTDFAVEFMLFDRFNASVEYFIKDSKDLLFSVPTPYSTGVSSIDANIGKISNKGVEIDLSYLIVNNKDLEIRLGANATFLKNKIKKLPDDQQEIISGTKKYMEGRSVYDFWLKQYCGVNPDNGDPVYLFDEEAQTWGDDCYELDGVKYTSNVAKALYDYSGSAIPKMQGGINLNVMYKGFELSTVFSYSLGSKIYNSSYAGLMSSTFGDAWHPDMLNAWKQPGDITNVPRLDSSNTTNNNASTSTRWLMKGDYFSFRSIALGYVVPKTFLNKIGIGLQSCRLSFTGENIFQWNTMKGLDAQSTFSGTTSNVYYPSRSFTFGLNVSF